MPARSPKNFLRMAGSILLAGFFFLSGCQDPFRAASPLDVQAYSTSANSLRGNTYRLEGEVFVLLAWSPSGRLVSVGIEDGQKVIPVLLPTALNHLNVEKGQRFKFLVEVDDRGVLRAKEAVKP